MNKKVLISLHDVTPFHLPRLQKAEALLTQWGVTKISYLFIPDYHQNNAKIDPSQLSGFREWVSTEKAFDVQWLLHGFYHLEILPAPGETGDPAVARPRTGLKDSFKRTFLTAQEGEFLGLSSVEITRRIRAAKAEYTAFFHDIPDTFISPAWLFNRHLIPVLKEQLFRLTEDHAFIYFLETSEKLAAPVITWATRTRLRKFLSRVGCTILYRLRAGNEFIRLAVHPFDFDHPGTIKSIEKVMKDVLNEREPILYKEITCLP